MGGTAVERLLVIDDEPAVRGVLAAALAKTGREIHEAGTAADGRAALGRLDDAVVLLDIGLPDASGLDLLAEFRRDDPHRIVIMLTARAEEEMVVGAMRAGAFDYVTKPFRIDAIRAMVDKAFALGARSAASREAGASPAAPPALETYLVGRSAPMLDLFKLVGKLAASDLPVLVVGESGTGKELVARALHRHGPNPAGPFVPVDCGGLPASLLEGELFGYERGAFTGAVAAKPGRFELADGGTLFLDEIGNLPVELQAKLLRALQERTTQRLGSTTSVRWNARLIAATNTDLKEAVAQGRFREDLLYRLAGVELRVPALRERLEDLPLLIGHFLARWESRKGRLTISPEALALLAAHHWPGNIRELEHAVNRAAALARTAVLGVEDLPEEVRAAPGGPATAPGPGTRADVLRLEDVKRRYARQALAACGGNKAETARALGIDRKTLSALLQEPDERVK